MNTYNNETSKTNLKSLEAYHKKMPIKKNLLTISLPIIRVQQQQQQKKIVDISIFDY